MFRASRAMGMALALATFAWSSVDAWAYEQEIKQQAEALAEGLERAGRKRLAVVDFLDLEGNATQLGRFLAEELSVTLSALPTGLEVVDRNHLSAILKEKKLSADGVTDPGTARRLGQILGVDVLVTGSLTSFGETVRVTTKALDAETAKLIAASRVDIAKVETIRALLATDLSGRTPGSPAKRSPGRDDKTASTRPSFDLPRSIEQNKFAFELKGCELTGRTAVCKIAVTNRSPERRVLTISGATQLYDDNGNSYKVSDAAIANIENRMYNAHSRVSMPLHHEVPVTAMVAFSDIAPDATRVAVLEVACHDKQARFTVTFKDVAFVADSLRPVSAPSRRAQVAVRRDAGAGRFEPQKP